MSRVLSKRVWSFDQFDSHRPTMRACLILGLLWALGSGAAGAALAGTGAGGSAAAGRARGLEWGRLRGGGAEERRGRVAVAGLEKSLAGVSLETGPNARLRIVKRSKHGVSLNTLDVDNAMQRQLHGPDTGPEPWVKKDAFAVKGTGQTAQIIYSADGRLLAQMEPGGVSVYDSHTGKLAFCCRGPEGCQLQGAHLTPKGSFLVTCCKPRKSADTKEGSTTWVHTSSDGEEQSTEISNGLAVWDIGSGDLCTSFPVGLAFSANEWPYIQWTTDESYACRKVKDGIEMITRKGMLSGGEVDEKLEIHGMTTAWMTSNVRRGEDGNEKKVWISVFIKGDTWGDGGKESKMQIFEYPGGFKKPFVSVGLGPAEECTIKWAYDASALLVLSTIVVDDRNDNYYGRTRLQFVRLDEAGVSNVKLDKEGPVHDASWSPNTREFAVVYGTMPARACLFNYRGQAQYSYGAGKFNTITWSPHGRFFVLGGFGNLPGKMQFWDKTTKKKLGEADAPCTIYKGFSPCSRFFLTAVTFPGLRVDNEIKLWKYDGTLLQTEKDIDELYQCEWMPSAPGSFVDRSASPDVIARATEMEIALAAGLGGNGMSLDKKGPQATGSWGSFSLHDEEKVAVGHVDVEHHERLANQVEAGEGRYEDYDPTLPFGTARTILSKSQKKRLAKKRGREKARGEVESKA